MANKKKMISESIANILNHAPVGFDEDDDELDQTSAKVSFVDHSDNDFEEVERTKLSRQNIDLLESIDQKYAGKVASRKNLKDSSDEYEQESVDDNDQESVADSSTENISEEEDNEDIEEENSEQSEIDEDDKTNFKHFKDSPAENQKGICVKNQLRLWENLLEIRIQLQKCLSASNKMPIDRNFQDFCLNGGEEYKTKLSVTKKSISNALNKMVDLQTLLVQKYPETKKVFSEKEKQNKLEGSDEEITSEEENVSDEESEGAPPKKLRKIEDYEINISRRHEKYKNYGKTVIQKWNDKTRIGTLSKNNSNSHSILNQIENILSDKSKLIKKTQLKRSNYQILGEIESDENDMCNLNIYDDDDFYHQLLRELIEFKSSDVTDPVQLGRQWVKLQNMRSKMKRKVDTKATKGRKLRFTVHTKLVNFMAPIENSSWTDEAKNELYNSLFGKKQVSK